MAEQSDRNVSPTALGEDEREHAFAFSLLKNLVVPTFVLDAQSKVIIWNLACERLTGMSSAEVIGTNRHREAFYDVPRSCLSDLIVEGRTGEVNDLYVRHAEIAGTTNGLYAENWCVMPRLGTRLYLAIDASPVYDKAGKLLAVIETIRDITVQKETQRALELLVTQDGLTGIANRRRFDQTLQFEWSRAKRDAKLLTVMMVDVDYFKKYNDAYGHQAGDECLKRIASTMTESVQRTIDLVARFGGEEFAVILPNATATGAAVVAERIRSAIEQLDLSGTDIKGGPVTTSIGVATATTLPTGSPEKLIAAADAALYQAKHAGRNRVVVVDLDAATQTPW